MNETPQQYIDRLLSNVGDADPWEILTSTAERLRQLVAGRSQADLAWKPAPDRWSVGEILAHLADCEVVAAWRLRTILATSGTTLQPFDQNRWAKALTYEHAPTDESLDVFEVNRRANVRLLRSVDPAMLDNFGVHAERGRESARHLVQLYAGHDRNHLRQIEGLLRR